MTPDPAGRYFVRRLAFLPLMVAVGCAAPPAPLPGGVRVAAAASLKPAVTDVAAALRTRTPPVAVTAAYAATGTLAAQVTNGAPFDLFLAADADTPRKLADAGHVAPDGVFPFATGRLVVWVHDGVTAPVETDGLKAVGSSAVRAVALANPRHAPYGRAAEAALRSAGAWDAVQPRIALGESVDQAANLLHTGAAEVGFLPASLLVPGGRTWAVPPELYPRIAHAGAVLKGAADPAATRAVRDFLCGPEGRAILARHGFGPPDEQDEELYHRDTEGTEKKR